jgi:hypothetical protein
MNTNTYVSTNTTPIDYRLRLSSWLTARAKGRGEGTPQIKYQPIEV